MNRWKTERKKQNKKVPIYYLFLLFFLFIPSHSPLVGLSAKSTFRSFGQMTLYLLHLSWPLIRLAFRTERTIDKWYQVNIFFFLIFYLILIEWMFYNIFFIITLLENISNQNYMQIYLSMMSESETGTGRDQPFSFLDN